MNYLNRLDKCIIPVKNKKCKFGHDDQNQVVFLLNSKIQTIRCSQGNFERNEEQIANLYSKN